MELLLLLFGGLAAGAGLWAALGKKDEAPPPPFFSKGGEDETKKRDAAAESRRPALDEPVVLGKDQKSQPPSLKAQLEKAKKKDQATREKAKSKSKPLTVSYKADQLIPPDSRYAFQRRPLKNADTLIDKQKGAEALAIYERIKNRIDDEEIKSKLNQNIEDIRKWLESGEDEEDEDRPAAEFVVPISDETVQSLTEGLKNVADELADKLARAFQNLPPPAPRQQPGPGRAEPFQLKSPIAEPEGDRGFAVNDRGDVLTDGWSDEDFEKEWEKFKNLPLKDKRSGDDRRTIDDRRGESGMDRKDRRDDDDRRKEDLFKERDEFLEKLEKHKRNKDQQNLLSDQGGSQAPPPSLPLKLDIEPQGPLAVPSLPYPGEAPAPLERFPSAEAPAAAPEAAGPEMPGPSDSSAPAAPEKEIPGAPAFGEGVEDVGEIPEIESPEESPEPEAPQVQEIRGVLELKPPEEDDAPFLTLTYDFAKIPDSFKLSRDYHTMEYVYYKYKPMLIKAQEFTRRKMLKNALNYYRVIKSQNIPPEFRRMINRNITDITEYLEKFLMRRG